jgi:hypothetical protein
MILGIFVDQHDCFCDLLLSGQKKRGKKKKQKNVFFAKNDQHLANQLI